MCSLQSSYLKRLKGESLILSTFQFFKLFVLYGSLFFELSDGQSCILEFFAPTRSHFSFINSGLSNKTSYPLQVAVLSTALFSVKIFVFDPLSLLTEESPWEVDPAGITREAISSITL